MVSQLLFHSIAHHVEHLVVATDKELSVLNELLAFDIVGSYILNGGLCAVNALGVFVTACAVGLDIYAIVQTFACKGETVRRAIVARVRTYEQTDLTVGAGDSGFVVAVTSLVANR